MELEMNGSERRKKILTRLQETSTPLSGSALGRETGVSRQVVVQDIALLRVEGYPILATARGYVLNQPKQNVRLFKVCHTNDQTEDELLTIVDLGGCILDVMVNHRIYGKMSAPLNIKNRRDVQIFINNLKSGKSSPLMNVTSGYHFHHISADQKDILEEIQKALEEKHYLTNFLPYELEEQKQ